MYIVYILKSDITNKYYIGFTSNIKNRLQNHNSGGTKSTKNGKPWKLIYQEEYNTKENAWKREQQLKKYKSGLALRKLLGEVA